MLFETVQSFGLLVAALAAMNAIFNVATATLATILGVTVERISMGVGPVLLRLPIGRSQLSFSLFPVAGSVSFSDAAARPDLDPRRLFVNAAWPTKMLVVLTGPLSVILTSIAILGPDAFREAANFWGDLARAILAAANPLDLHSLIWPMIDSGGFLTAGAIIAVKAASFNLLPIPILNGGALLILVIEAAAGRKLPEVTLEWLYRVGFALMVAVLGVIAFRLALGVLG